MTLIIEYFGHWRQNKNPSLIRNGLTTDFLLYLVSGKESITNSKIDSFLCFFSLFNCSICIQYTYMHHNAYVY